MVWGGNLSIVVRKIMESKLNSNKSKAKMKKYSIAQTKNTPKQRTKC